MKAIALLFIIFLAACSTPLELRNVDYQVTCSSGTCDIEYTAETGERTVEGVSNWSKNFDAYTKTALYIFAKKNQEPGDLTVQILIDGDTYKSETTSSDFGEVEIETVVR